MESEQICLKWNNFPLNITRNIDDLWKDESLVDVTIYSEGQCIQAHKVILSASSPLFKNIFAVNPCQHPVIILQDVRFQELLSIISFIYKGEINIEQENLIELLKAAKTLQISGLSDSVNLTDNQELLNDVNKCPAKKRRMYNTSFSNTIEEDCSFNLNQEFVVKTELDREELVQPESTVPTINKEYIKNDSNNSSENLQPVISSESGAHDSAWFTARTEETSNAAFRCPFCDRAYASWGYRRRHIKAVHCKINEIACRWCPKIYFTPELWTQHVADKHNVLTNDAQQGIEILEEAKKVLHMKNENPKFDVRNEKDR